MMMKTFKAKSMPMPKTYKPKKPPVGEHQTFSRQSKQKAK